MRIAADTTSMASAILRHWQENQRVLLASAERISTGTTLNRAVDDAAGVAIADRMRARMDSGLQAQRNAQDGISVLDVADGALSSMTELIQQMRVLAVQSANGTFDDTSRGYLQTGVVHTLDELDAIVERSRAAGRSILGGADITVQVGPDAGDTVSMTFGRTDRDGLGVAGIDISSQEGATSALDMLDAAIDTLMQERARAAAVHQQFERISAQLARSGMDHAMTLSRAADVDIAHEATQMARAHLLTDVAAELMAEVTRVQRSVLELLRPLDLETPPGPDAGVDSATRAPVDPMTSVPAASVATGPPPVLITTNPTHAAAASPAPRIPHHTGTVDEPTMTRPLHPIGLASPPDHRSPTIPAPVGEPLATTAPRATM